MNVTTAVIRWAQLSTNDSDQGHSDAPRLASHRLDRAMVTAIRVVAIFGLNWLAWHYAALFDVSPRVSAMFLSAAVAVIVPMLLGAKWLPLLYVAHGSVALLASPGWTIADFDYLGTLRVVAVYGLMGLYLRRAWSRSYRRFSLDTATRFVSAAFVASLTATALTRLTNSYASLPPEESGIRFLSMWNGDFSGVMVGVPALLLVWGMAASLSRRGERPTEPAIQRVTWTSIARHGLLAISAACFCAWLPSALGVNASIAIVMIVPMALAGLYCGAMVGFAMAGLSCVTYLLVASSLGIVHNPTIDLQLVFALSSALALLSGAARDDRLHQWRRANYDLLTGLPNRQLLADRFEQARRRAQRSGKPMAILYLDLDHFKEVNDTLGHDAGDHLLVQAAERITRCLRTCDTVSRLGGDEFVVVLSDVEEPSGVDRVAVNILAALARPFSLKEGLGHVSGSLGIAVYPDHGNDLQILQCLADRALYEAKRAGRNCHKRHTASGRRGGPTGHAAG